MEDFVGIDTLFTKINVPHILEKIFFSLDYDSFMECRKARKEWNELLSSERYQKEEERMLAEKIDVEERKSLYLRNVEEMTYLLSSGVDTNCVALHDDGLIHRKRNRAATKGRMDVVQLLLDTGAHPNKADKFGNTPLHRAAWRSCKDMVQLLLDKGADLNKAAFTGGTPLHHAAKRGNKDVVQLLLDKRADPNKAYCFGLTPLRDAAVYGHEYVVQLLLDRGADPKKKDNQGRTPQSLLT